MENKAVFLDRDGTINVEVGYLSSPLHLVLIPGSAEAIKILKEAGFKVIVVTNQAGVARGYFTEETVEQIHQQLQAELRKREASLDAFYWCPHHPEFSSEECSCRKPKPGLFFQAAADFKIDLGKSYVVGDSAKDILAAKNAGCKSILVLTGYGQKEKEALADNKPDYIADNLLAAARWIVKREQRADSR